MGEVCCCQELEWAEAGGAGGPEGAGEGPEAAAPALAAAQPVHGKVARSGPACPTAPHIPPASLSHHGEGDRRDRGAQGYTNPMKGLPGLRCCWQNLEQAGAGFMLVLEQRAALSSAPALSAGTGFPSCGSLERCCGHQTRSRAPWQFHSIVGHRSPTGFSCGAQGLWAAPPGSGPLPGAAK